MGNLIITIGREYGSGGREIGEKLAKKLGFNYYNDELLERVSQETGIDKDLFRNVDEKQKQSFWYTMAMASFSTTDSVNSLTDLPMSDKLFIEQARVIEEIANNENAVIVGRCSNYILKDRTNVLNVFIYADMNSKIKRKMQVLNINEKAAKKQIIKNEKERKAYYNYFTNGDWGKKEDYDLCINSSKIDIDEIVDMICKYIKK